MKKGKEDTMDAIRTPAHAGPEGPAQFLARDGDLAIRKMRDDPEDYKLMERWLSDARVLEFVYGRDNPHSYERIEQKFGPRARGVEPVTPCLILYRDEAIGYAQFYPAAEDDYELEDARETYGLDMFIGEPAHWGRGIGTRALLALTRHLIEERGLRKLVMDPHTGNPRAIRCYEKAGFRRIKVLVAHEMHESVWRDCWLMMKGR